MRMQLGIRFEGSGGLAIPLQQLASALPVLCFSLLPLPRTTDFSVCPTAEKSMVHIMSVACSEPAAFLSEILCASAQILSSYLNYTGNWHEFTGYVLLRLNPRWSLACYFLCVVFSLPIGSYTRLWMPRFGCVSCWGPSITSTVDCVARRCALTRTTDRVRCSRRFAVAVSHLFTLLVRVF